MTRNKNERRKAKGRVSTKRGAPFWVEILAKSRENKGDASVNRAERRRRA